MEITQMGYQIEKKYYLYFLSKCQQVICLSVVNASGVLVNIDENKKQHPTVVFIL